MKSIIILILLIGTAISTTTMTSGTATKWQLTSSTPATGQTFDFQVMFSTGAATGNVATTTQEIGLVCLVLTSNFTIAANTAGQAGFAMTSTAGAGTAAISAITNWGAIVTKPLATVTYVSDVSITTTLTSVACAAANVDAITLTSNVIKWAFDITGACANIPLKSATTTWYGRCFHKAASSTALVASANNFAVSAALNVTIGASTFAAGATILAGIAYLQF
jgi:hypothetical protein